MKLIYSVIDVKNSFVMLYEFTGLTIMGVLKVALKKYILRKFEQFCYNYQKS